MTRPSAAPLRPLSLSHDPTDEIDPACPRPPHFASTALDRDSITAVDTPVSRWSSPGHAGPTSTGHSACDKSTSEKDVMLNATARFGNLERAVSEGPDRATPEGVFKQRVVRLPVPSGHAGPGEEVVLIDWAEGDPRNPFNWPAYKKWLCLFAANYITLVTAMNAVPTTIFARVAPPRFGVSKEVFLLSSTVWFISTATFPLFLAPLSEVFGRNLIYQVTSVLTALLFIPQALSKSFAALIVVRWIQGGTCSVGNSMVGGTVADMWKADERGFPMSLFTATVFLGQGLGTVSTGWMTYYHGISWGYGIIGLVGAGSCIVNVFVLRETRGDVLLRRYANRLNKRAAKDGGDHRRYICVADLQRTDVWTLMRISVVRPLYYLVSEPIVSAICIWVGFAWSCIYLGAAANLLVFAQYGWNLGGLSCIELVVSIAGIIGAVLNSFQDRIYFRETRKARLKGARPPPEARLHLAAFAGLLFPLSLYVFAWTGKPSIPWPVPMLFLIFENVGVYLMYSGVFNYFADTYEKYSSSAQASQSFARNIGSAFFPLFANAMYDNLGYPQASTVVASIALALQVCPILIFFYGHRLRARSKVAQELAREQAEKEKEEEEERERRRRRREGTAQEGGAMSL